MASLPPYHYHQFNKVGPRRYCILRAVKATDGGSSPLLPPALDISSWGNRPGARQGSK